MMLRLEVLTHEHGIYIDSRNVMLVMWGTTGEKPCTHVATYQGQCIPVAGTPDEVMRRVRLAERDERLGLDADDGEGDA